MTAPAPLAPDAVQRLKDQVIELWCSGLDTEEIAGRLGESLGPHHRLSEAWCHRIVMAWNSQQIAAGLSLSKAAARFTKASPLKGRSATASIIETVADHFGIPRADILSDSRMAPYARSRQIAMYLSREITGLSFPELGLRFRRDHTTVIHAWQVVPKKIAAGDWRLAGDIQAVRGKLLEKWA